MRRTKENHAVRTEDSLRWCPPAGEWRNTPCEGEAESGEQKTAGTVTLHEVFAQTSKTWLSCPAPPQVHPCPHREVGHMAEGELLNYHIKPGSLPTLWSRNTGAWKR